MLDAADAAKAVAQPSGSASKFLASVDKLVAGVEKHSASRPTTLPYAVVVGATGDLSPVVATTRAASARAASTSAKPYVKLSGLSTGPLTKGDRMARFALATAAARAPIPKHVQAPTPSDVTNVGETGEQKAKRTTLTPKDARLFRRTDKLEKRMDMWLEKAQLTLSAGSQVVALPKRTSAKAPAIASKPSARKAQSSQQASMLKPPKVAGRTENPRLTKAKAKFMQRLQKAKSEFKRGIDRGDDSSTSQSDSDSGSEPLDDPHSGTHEAMNDQAAVSANAEMEEPGEKNGADTIGAAAGIMISNANADVAAADGKNASPFGEITADAAADQTPNYEKLFHSTQATLLAANTLYANKSDSFKLLLEGKDTRYEEALVDWRGTVSNLQELNDTKTLDYEKLSADHELELEELIESCTVALSEANGKYDTVFKMVGELRVELEHARNKRPLQLDADDERTDLKNKLQFTRGERVALLVSLRQSEANEKLIESKLHHLLDGTGEEIPPFHDYANVLTAPAFSAEMTESLHAVSNKTTKGESVHVPIAKKLGGAKLKNPESFSGAASDRIRVWIPQMTNYLVQTSAPESEWVGIAQSYLMGQALQVWHHAIQGNDDALPFSKLAEVLTTRYGPYNPERVARQEIRNLKQGSMRGVEYDLAFRALLSDIPNYDERTMIDLFIDGLNQNLKLDCDFDNRTYKPWTSLNDLTAFVNLKDSSSRFHSNVKVHNVSTSKRAQPQGNMMVVSRSRSSNPRDVAEADVASFQPVHHGRNRQAGGGGGGGMNGGGGGARPAAGNGHIHPPKPPIAEAVVNEYKAKGTTTNHAEYDKVYKDWNDLCRTHNACYACGGLVKIPDKDKEAVVVPHHTVSQCTIKPDKSLWVLMPHPKYRKG